MPPTAELEAPETEVEKTEPGKTSLSQVFKETLKKQQAATAEPEPKSAPKKEEAKAEPEAKKPDAKAAADEAAKAAEAEKAKGETKKVSALDAVLDPAKAKVEAPATDELPANAPAKLLREAMERHKAEAIKWKGEAEKAAKGDPTTRAQLETLQQEREKLAKENAELREAITVVNVDLDPDVRRKFHDGKISIIDKTTKAVEQYGGNSKAFQEAMEMKPGKAQTLAIKEALEEVDEIDRTEIYNKIAKVRELEEEHADLLKNSQKSYAELTEKQKARARDQAAHIEQSKAEVFDRATKALVSDHPTMNTVPDTAEGHEEWNARLNSDRENALKMLGDAASLEEISAVAMKGVRYDFVESLLLNERNVTKELRDRLAKYESAEPGFNGRAKSEKTSDADKTPSQRWREKMATLTGKSE